MKKRTLKQRIQLRLKKSSKQVFLRKDFLDLGGYDQVGRALAEIMKDGDLTKVGMGLYAKARPSSFKKGETVLAAPGGFKAVSREALDRLGVPWRPSKAEEDYNSASTTQVPFNAAVSVRKRFSRRIQWRNLKLDYQVDLSKTQADR